uniref:Phosphatidylinositol-specific phospholipase C X domain-containing protein n=1 Tax=viral metagenome TaxID=1070528 RepID=A0A6C0M452_9ZZZZ
MDTLPAILALGLAAYILSDEIRSKMGGDEPTHSGRLCDYRCPGVVFKPISAALARGVRLLEVHIAPDPSGEPLVMKRIDDEYDGDSFESVCVTLVNEAFPSEYPLILSIVPHTDSTVTLNRVAYHLKTTLHRQILETQESVDQMLLGQLANKLVIVAGPEVRGSNLEKLVSLSWGSSALRRLEYSQAVHPRDPEELRAYNRDHITLVGPTRVYPDAPLSVYTYGCQWNLFGTGSGFEAVP